MEASLTMSTQPSCKTWAGSDTGPCLQCQSCLCSCYSSHSESAKQKVTQKVITYWVSQSMVGFTGRFAFGQPKRSNTCPQELEIRGSLYSVYFEQLGVSRQWLGLTSCHSCSGRKTECLECWVAFWRPQSMDCGKPNWVGRVGFDPWA